MGNLPQTKQKVKACRCAVLDSVDERSMAHANKIAGAVFQAIESTRNQFTLSQSELLGIIENQGTAPSSLVARVRGQIIDRITGVQV